MSLFQTDVKMEKKKDEKKFKEFKFKTQTDNVAKTEPENECDGDGGLSHFTQQYQDLWVPGTRSVPGTCVNLF